MAPSARGWEMIRVVSVLVGLATIAVVLRIVARLKTRMKFGTDDYLCFVGIVFLYGMLIELILWCSIGGNGTHVTELNAHTIETFLKIFLANQFTYFVLCPVIKISIICFYRRIFVTRRFQVITFGVNCLIGAWGAGIFLASALQCRPLRGYWDKSINGHCFDDNKFFIVNQVFNVIMDFVILGLPLPIIWGLHRVWQEKLALSGIFALGGFVCFASIYRIVVLFFIQPQDTTYTVYQATLWTHVEPSVGMICACLPIIRGLFPIYRFSTSRAEQSLPPFTTSNQISSSNPRSSVYIKMADTKAFRAESDDGLVRDMQDIDGTDLDRIRVRTDIQVVRG
ncbi:MAG: hypothetical protein M1818_002506 [Claussenomyces sp. TS43310]|nr:MAG: hypothetical protein M1818_002506 [Claussenomyces sp. TS43310]